MIEAKWVSLQSDVIAPPTTPPDAKWAEERPSPYDVPTHIRSFYDPANGLLTIELKYIADEERSEYTIEPYFKCMLGKRTRRIYAVHFDIHTFQRDRRKIAQETERSIGKLPDNDGAAREITLRAIRSKEQQLFASVE